MKFSERLKFLREQKNISQTELGKFLGKSKSTISMYENNSRTPSFETQEAIADFFNVDLDYLRGRSDIPSRFRITNDFPDMSDILIPIKREKVPVIGSMACGEPVFREEDFPAYVAVGNEVKADAAVIARGDSMIGARINNGDIVFIHYQPTVENGEIAAIWVDDGFTIKRVYQYGDTIVLRPENSDYDETIYKEDDAVNIKIIGKAVAFQSDVK